MTDTAQQLRSIIERVERLESERKGLVEDIREIFSEAKSSGFDVPALRAIIRLRAKPKVEREQQEAIVESYLAALGE